jgi:hypothetical protein
MNWRNSIDKKNNHLWGLLAIFLFHLVVNYQILHQSQIPRINDEGGRISYGFSFFHRFLSKPHVQVPALFKNVLQLSSSQYHPHLFDILEAVCFKLLASWNVIDIDSMVFFANSFLLAVLLISVYTIGSIVYDKGIGLLSATLVSFFPLVFGHSRVAMLDYPLMCTVALSMALLVATRKFDSIFYSILAGIAFSVAQLTKESAVLFIMPPFVMYGITSYVRGNKNKVLVHSAITLALFCFISGAVYLRKENLGAFATYPLKIAICNAPEHLYYIKDFVKYVGPFILIVSAPLLLSYLVYIKKREWFLSAWIFIPLILFSLSPNKTPRFILPVFPAYALIVIGEIAHARWFRPFRRAMVFCIVLVAFAQYYLLNTGVLTFKYSLPSKDTGVLAVYKDKYACARDGILGIIKKELKQGPHGMAKSPRYINCLFDIPEIYWPLNLQMQLQNAPYRFNCYTEKDEADIKRDHLEHVKWGELILSSDYIIDKNGDRGIPEFVRFINDAQRKVFEENKRLYEMIGTVPVYDGSLLFVYKKIQ